MKDRDQRLSSLIGLLIGQARSEELQALESLIEDLRSSRRDLRELKFSLMTLLKSAGGQIVVRDRDTINLSSNPEAVFRIHYDNKTESTVYVLYEKGLPK